MSEKGTVAAAKHSWLNGREMDLDSLIAFFKWCTVIDGAILVVWALFTLAAPGLIYRTQSRWFPMGRETFTLVNYCFLGAFKLLFLLLNAAPLAALLIVRGLDG